MALTPLHHTLKFLSYLNCSTSNNPSLLSYYRGHCGRNAVQGLQGGIALTGYFVDPNSSSSNNGEGGGMEIAEVYERNISLWVQVIMECKKWRQGMCL